MWPVGGGWLTRVVGEESDTGGTAGQQFDLLPELAQAREEARRASEQAAAKVTCSELAGKRLQICGTM